MVGVNDERYIENHEPYITQLFNTCLIDNLQWNSDWLSFVSQSSGGDRYYNVEVIPNKKAKKRKEFYYWDFDNFLLYLVDIQEDLDHINRDAAEKIWEFLVWFIENHPTFPGEGIEDQYESILDSTDKNNSQNIRDTQNTIVSEGNMSISLSSSSENSLSIGKYTYEDRKYYWIVRFQFFQAEETDMSSYVNKDYSQNQLTISKKGNLSPMVENFLPYYEMIDLRKIKVSSMLEIKMTSSEGQSTEDSWHESENIDCWKREKIGDLLDKLLRFGAIRAVSNGLTFKIESFEIFSRITSLYE